jgi:hypothetical protein
MDALDHGQQGGKLPPPNHISLQDYPMPPTIFRLLLICLAVLFSLTAGLSATGTIHASDDAAASEPASSATRTGKLYLASDDPMADLAAGIDAAKNSKRPLLIVMGANWCHDSRALASRLYKEPLSTTVNENYEILFVDVGYLEKGKEVINSFGIPVYYATPTVLIVDPDTGLVVNDKNRHQWANAANISMEESLEYFQLFAEYEPNALQSEAETDANLHVLLTEIKAFEQIQADRLYQAYAVLGPMLHAYKKGDKDAFSQATWDEVRDYRYQIPGDVDALQIEARERVAAGETDIQLNYPVYPAFSWDQE